MSQELDPFTQVYRALWALAETSKPLDSLVKRGNRVRYDTKDQSPMKSAVQDADMPELRLVTSGSPRTNLHSSSSSSDITRIYTWQIATGNVMLAERLYPVEFAVLCAMTNWKSVLGALTWRGQHFVKAANAISAQEMLTQSSDVSRKMYGWVAVWSIEVRMVFSTNSLKEFNDGCS